MVEFEFGYVKDERGADIAALRREIWDANAFEVIAGTNGFCGGDAGHGSRTFLQIKDLAGTCFEDAEIMKDSGNNITGFKIMLGGDSELRTLIDALRFAADALESLSTKKYLGD